MHQCVWAAELSGPVGFVSREKKKRSKQKAIVFTLQYGHGKEPHAGIQTPFPPPARVFSEEEASADTIIAMRGKRPPVPGYLLSNQIRYVIFIYRMSEVL